LLVGSDFQERQIAFKDGPLGDIFGEEHVNEFFETGFEAMRAFFVSVGDDGHARDLFVFRGSDGEGVNIDGEAPGEGRDAIQDAGFIFDVGDQCLHGSSLCFAKN
jgi:hypothetical protein